QLDKRLPVALLLARGYANFGRLGQLPVAVVVVGTQRLFEPENAVLGKSASPLQRRFRIPHQPRVDQQVGAVSEALPPFPNQGNVRLLVLPHRIPPELHGSEPLIAIAAGEVARLLRSRSEQGAGVAADLLVKPAPEQLPDRLSERLSLDIPQRHIDAA